MSSVDNEELLSDGVTDGQSSSLEKVGAALLSKEDVLQEQNEEPAAEQESAEKDESASWSEEEREARELGWVPKEEFKGKEKNWRDPNAFLERRNYMNTIHRLKGDVRHIVNKFDSFIKNINAQQEEDIKQKAVQLRELRREAIKNGNVEEVERIDEIFNSYTDRLNTVKQETKQPDVSENVKEFVVRNQDWFNRATRENESMVDYATKMEQHFKSIYPNDEEEDILMKVERAVKKEYSHRFPSDEVKKAPAVLTSSADAVSKKAKRKIGFSDMPYDIQQTINSIIRYVPMSKDEYARQLYESGAVKL